MAREPARRAAGGLGLARWLGIAIALAVVALGAVGTGTLAAPRPASAHQLVRQDLHDHITETVDQAIAGRSPDTAMNLYRTQDHSAGIFERNPEAWVYAAVDSVACASPSNSRGANRRAGTLITPRHAILANHFKLHAGDTMTFVADDDTVHVRTITAAMGHPDYSYYYPDLRVVVLDQDLPASIKPCKVASPELASMLTDPVPALALNQHEEGLINSLNSLSSHASYVEPADPTQRLYYKALVSGDSGNPSFLTIGGELVLMTVWTFGGAGSGANISRFVDDIDEMIEVLDVQAADPTGYRVAFPDLEVFGGGPPASTPVPTPTATPTPGPRPADHSGDLDCDNGVDIQDAHHLARFLAGQVEGSSECGDVATGAIYAPAADLNRDAEITADDARALLGCLVGTPDCLAAGAAIGFD